MLSVTSAFGQVLPVKATASNGVSHITSELSVGSSAVYINAAGFQSPSGIDPQHADISVLSCEVAAWL